MGVNGRPGSAQDAANSSSDEGAGDAEEGGVRGGGDRRQAAGNQLHKAELELGGCI
jgi:hypothetical protein